MQFFTRGGLIIFLLSTKIWALSGDVDQGFGFEGRTITDFFGRTDFISNLLIDGAGNIIAAGAATKQRAADHFALVRYTNDGLLDPSFGLGGKVTTNSIAPQKTVEEGIFGSGLQKNNALVVIGRGNFSGRSGLVMLRYNHDGALDQNFGDTGSTFVPDSVHSYSPLDLVIDKDDRIIVIAAAFDSESSSSFAVFRFNAEGILDPSFGEKGMSITEIAPGTDVPRAVKIDKQNKIVVGGFSGAHQFTVVRYNDDGFIDLSFGELGIATILFNENGIDTLHALVIQEDGKIVIGGDVQVGSYAGLRMIDFGLARLLPDGNLDPSFNQGGTQITWFEQRAASTLWALSLQKDGKIIAVGDASIVNGLGIARYNHDGSLDEHFGAGGKKVVAYPRTSHWETVALQDDGKIVCGGYAFNGKHYDLVIARFEP